MSKVDARNQKRLWMIAMLTVIAVLIPSYLFGAISTKQGQLDWKVCFLILILTLFLVGIRRITLAMQGYKSEEEACDQTSEIMESGGGYQDHSAKLVGRLPGSTAIDRRVALARSAPDLDTASAIVQIPLGLDIEEGRTFGYLQFLRNGLVLLGLLSTVISFAAALSHTDADDLGPLIGELRRALTMTMAGVLTSIVLGWRTSVLYVAQQEIKARIEELTARMLPRLVARYEKGAQAEPGPTLFLEKLHDYFSEVTHWRQDILNEVQALTATLTKHRNILATLPQLTLPQSFSELNTTLNNLSNAVDQSRQVVDQALKILVQERSINLNEVIQLLKEMRLDTEQVKLSQKQVLDEIVPGQTEALMKLGGLTTELQKIPGALNSNAETQKGLIKTIEELAQLNKSNGEVIAKMNEQVGVFIQKVDNIAKPMPELAAIEKAVTALTGVVKELHGSVRDGKQEMKEALEKLQSETANTNQHLNGVNWDRIVAPITEAIRQRGGFNNYMYGIPHDQQQLNPNQLAQVNPPNEIENRGDRERLISSPKKSWFGWRNERS